MVAHAKVLRQGGVALALLAVAAAAAMPSLAGEALAQASYDPPLVQHERVLAQAVVCNEGLELVIRGAGGAPACVSPGAKAVLLERGWGAEPPDVPRTPSIALTDDERAWLAANPIRASYDPYWPPFEFTNADGQFDGLSAAYMAEFERLIGSDFEVVDSPDWPGALQAVRDGRVDVLFMTGDTPDRREFLGFAPPITTLTTVMITLGDDVDAGDLGSKNVGTIRGYEVEAWLDENRPDVAYIPFDEGLAFTALQAGDIDVLLWFWEVADYKARLAGVEGLYNAGETGHSMDVGVAYTLASPNVGTIVEKAMAAVSEVDRDRMLNEAVMARPTPAMIASSSMSVAVPDEAPPMETQQLDLTASERAWLGSGPTIRVAYDPDWPPIEFDIDGEVAGLSAAYMQMAQAITGAEFVSAPSDSWAEALDSMRTGEADVMFAVARTGDRESFMGFTGPHTTLPWHIVTASDRSVEAEDLGTLRVGTLEGYSVEAWLEENRPDIRFTSYANYEDLLADLETGKIEAFIEVWPVASMRAGMSGMQVFKAGQLGASIQLSIGYTSANPVLGSIMTKFADAVPEEFSMSVAADLVPPPMAPTLALSPGEAAWIADNPVVQVAYDPDVPPYEYIDEGTGELAGLTRSYMDRFSSLMGVQFEPVELGTWTEALDAMRSGDADVMFMVPVTEEREEFMGFTEPHTSLTWDMLTIGEPRAVGDDELADLRVGAVKDYAIVSWIGENLPEVRVTEFDDHAAALTALDAGDLDVFVDSWGSSWYAAQRAGIDDLNNAGSLGPPLDLVIGYSKNNNRVLGSILAKALAEVPVEERQRLASLVAPPPPGQDGEGQDAAAMQEQQPLELTDEEAVWVSDNPSVMVAYDPEFEPYEYIDEGTGELVGLTRSYMDRFASLTGLEFEPAMLGTWAEALDAMRSGDADVMFMVAETEERRDFMGFTEPHTSPTWDLIAIGGGDMELEGAGDLEGLEAGTIRGYAVVSWLAENAPGADVAEYDGHAAALAALESGEIKVFVDTWPSAQAAAQDAGVEGLYKAGSLDTALDMRIGYSTAGDDDDGSVLGSILAKALAAVPADERAMLASQLAPDDQPAAP